MEDIQGHNGVDGKTRVFSSGPYEFSGNVRGGKVDTKTLVVGQDLRMVSGCYMNRGKVVEVTPSGVDVEITVRTPTPKSIASWRAGKITSGEMKTDDQKQVLHFDTNGRSYVTELPPSYDPSAHPMSPWRWDGNGTYECGPWELDDIPFEG